MGKAAIHQPALAILSHTPPGATETICWVGKGIVYDTGGLSIKGKVCVDVMVRCVLICVCVRMYVLCVYMYVCACERINLCGKESGWMYFFRIKFYHGH